MRSGRLPGQPAWPAVLASAQVRVALVPDPGPRGRPAGLRAVPYQARTRRWPPPGRTAAALRPGRGHLAACRHRDGPPSALALSSIRALAASMITAMMAWTLPRRRRRAVRKRTPRYPALSWAVPAYPRASSPARWPNVSTAFSSASGTRRSR